ncbi:MAG: hypothetical protein FWF59_00550 [Turicibacter sp.]|nr:hypothetical protein [Turicibacter sp.]
MVKKIFGVGALATVLAGCLSTRASGNSQLNIGYGSGFLSSPIYAAEHAVNLHYFQQASDIVYGLLGGSLDGGFLQVDRFVALMESNTDFLDSFTIMGTIDYPFGATLIVREDLSHLRLQDVGNLNIAVTSPGSNLLEAFLEDAERLGVDTAGITYTFMPYRTMVPALTEGEVDAILIRGDHALVGLEAGHFILYQNWDLEGGDACCPAIVDQAAKVFLSRSDKVDDMGYYIQSLMATRLLNASYHRGAVAEHTNLPADLMFGMPVPEFSLADDGLIEIFEFMRNEHYHSN